MDTNLSRMPRVTLKHQLFSERQKLYGKRFLPECAFCGEGIEGAPDMNEVLFTKGDVARAEHLKPLIDDRCNCVLVHPGGGASKCHAGAHTKEGQSRAIRHLIFWEGSPALHAYVDRMSEHMRGSQCEDAHRLINNQ